jgi:uncharacterized Zn finger protein
MLMDEEKYERSVVLMCPTCGCTDFSEEDPSESEEATVTCQSCGRTLRKDELIQENGEAIEAATDEMVEEVLKDIEKKFKGSINIRIG